MITRITAHRGASYLAEHENTLESFQLAIQLKADKVEFDIRRTSDRKLVIFHDSTFFDQPIAFQTYREMQQHAAEEGYRIPLFEEVVQLCAGRIYMDIEIKEAGYEQEIIDVLHKYCKYTEYSIKSFEDPAVYHVKKLDPNITTGLLLGKDRRDVGYFLFRFKEIYPVRRLRQAGCDFVAPYTFYATPLFIRRMHKHHYPVQVWTVDKEKQMRKFLRRGVDEIVTNKPDLGLVARRKFYAARRKKK